MSTPSPHTHTLTHSCTHTSTPPPPPPPHTHTHTLQHLPSHILPHHTTHAGIQQLLKSLETLSPRLDGRQEDLQFLSNMLQSDEFHSLLKVRLWTPTGSSINGLHKQTNKQNKTKNEKILPLFLHTVPSATLSSRGLGMRLERTRQLPSFFLSFSQMNLKCC